ncbi:MAG: DUF937 domain-containing protein [Lachnospiraceae bacterium]|nr:DUF937 domain-containing protein [Lachnospiraceae bacterium]
MNLLSMLTGSMTSDSSVDALSEKTGLSSSVVSGVVSAALPMLLSALTKNASSEDGAKSLLGALSQHTDTSSMAAQFSGADAADGSAIIGHILGQKTGKTVKSISKKTGASTDQVTSLLDNLAPAMMSGLSAATTSAKSSNTGDGFDFSDLLGAFGGSAEAASSAIPSAGGMLGGLFGGSKKKSSQDGSSLLSSLLGMMG